MRTVRIVAALLAGQFALSCHRAEEAAPSAEQLADCEVMYALARQHYGYSTSNPGPRLRSPERPEIAACAWADNGLAFADRIPDNRFNWVQFDRPVYTSEGARVRTIRYESNDTPTLHFDCHFNRSNGQWFLGKCIKSLGARHQGME